MDIFKIPISVNKNKSRLLSYTVIEIPSDGHTSDCTVLVTH